MDTTQHCLHITPAPQIEAYAIILHGHDQPAVGGFSVPPEILSPGQNYLGNIVPQTEYPRKNCPHLGKSVPLLQLVVAVLLVTEMSN